MHRHVVVSCFRDNFECSVTFKRKVSSVAKCLIALCVVRPLLVQMSFVSNGFARSFLHRILSTSSSSSSTSFQILLELFLELVPRQYVYSSRIARRKYNKSGAKFGATTVVRDSVMWEKINKNNTALIQHYIPPNIRVLGERRLEEGANVSPRRVLETTQNPRTAPSGYSWICREPSNKSWAAPTRRRTKGRTTRARADVRRKRARKRANPPGRRARGKELPRGRLLVQECNSRLLVQECNGRLQECNGRRLCLRSNRCRPRSLDASFPLLERPVVLRLRPPPQQDNEQRAPPPPKDHWPPPSKEGGARTTAQELACWSSPPPDQV